MTAIENNNIFTIETYQDTTEGELDLQTPHPGQKASSKVCTGSVNSVFKEVMCFFFRTC